MNGVGFALRKILTEVGAAAFLTGKCRFVDEAGNEIGSFQSNLAVDTRGHAGNVASRQSIQDFGQGGMVFGCKVQALR